MRPRPVAHQHHAARASGSPSHAEDGRPLSHRRLLFSTPPPIAFPRVASSPQAAARVPNTFDAAPQLTETVAPRDIDPSTLEYPDATPKQPEITSTETIDSGIPSCYICLEPFDTGSKFEIPLKLPCGHEFGSVCISEWLHVPSRKNGCPLCRKDLFKSAKDERRRLLQDTTVQIVNTVNTRSAEDDREVLPNLDRMREVGEQNDGIQEEELEPGEVVGDDDVQGDDLEPGEVVGEERETTLPNPTVLDGLERMSNAELVDVINSPVRYLTALVHRGGAPD